MNNIPIAAGVFDAAGSIYTINGVPAEATDIIDMGNENTEFDPVLDIDGDGVKPRDAGGGVFLQRVLEIKTPLLTQLLTHGFTLVLEGKVDATGFFSFDCHDPFFNVETFGEARTIHTKVVAQDGGFFTDTDDVLAAGVVGKIAFTVTETHMAFSVNGLSAHSISPAPALALGGDIDEVQLNVAGDGTARLRSFAFYEPVDDTDLPALSTP